MAIESTNFFSFLKQTRSPIGLVDAYNLSEIYNSDQRTALTNLFLNPEGLDQISGLSKNGILQEDIRLVGGLDKPVINSLALFDETKSIVSFDLSTMVRVGDPVGEPGKSSFVTDQYSDNLVVVHGGLAAKNIEYDFIDIGGEVRTTSVSTSRESLFNSQSDPNDSTKYGEASYPGLLRVRRRSHLNTLKLNKKLFVEKSTIVESPAAKVNIPVYMRTSVTASPSLTLLKSYATKNSPVVLPIRVVGGGSFSLGVSSQISNNYYFGYEIKRKSDLAPVLSASYFNSKDSVDIPISFNLNGTIGNNVNCYLYIYCVPSLINKLNLSGLGLKEDLGQDIGLVGFDNLEELDLSNNGLSTIPTWIKVNYKTLKTFNISGNAFWNNGIISYFDYQTSPGVRGSANQSVPALSVTQVMAYSGYRSASSTNGSTDTTGKITDYKGTLDTIVDADGTTGITSARKFIDGRKNDLAGSTACTIDEANGFRVFSSVNTLTIGTSFRHHNTDLSKIFPNLRYFSANRSNDNSPNGLYGLIPKINNPPGRPLMGYSISNQRAAGGNFKYLGNKISYAEIDSDKDQFIGRFRFQNWVSDHVGYGGTTLCGGICTNDGLINSGKIPDTKDNSEYRYSQVPSGESIVNAWDGWLKTIENIGIWQNDIAFNIAEGQSLEWKLLKSVVVSYNGSNGVDTKVKYNVDVSSSSGLAIDILTAPALQTIDGWNSGWGGRIFSIQGAKNLVTLHVGNSNWEGYENGKYLLPTNFAIDTDNINDQNQLENFEIHDLQGGSSKELEFRNDDLKKLGKLKYFELSDSYFSGKFPEFVDENKNNVAVDVYLKNNRFYDVSNLGTTVNNRFRRINALYQGTGVGGCLLPNFTITPSNNRLTDVRFTGSLSSTYKSGWNDSAKSGKPVFNMLHGVDNAPSGVVSEVTTPSQTFTSVADPSSTTATLSNILKASSNFAISSYVRVGDKVLNSNNEEIATVLQIREESNTYIYISENLNLNAATLNFKRAGQNISEYFKNATALEKVHLENCSLVGPIPKFEGNGGRLKEVILSNNMLNKYQTDTLRHITGAAQGKTSKPNIYTIDLRYNPLSKDDIRSIITDAYEIAKFHGNNMNTLTINIRATRANITAGAFINWQIDEIFTEGTDAIPGVPGVPGTPGDPDEDPPVPPTDPVPEIPGIPAVPDPLFVKYNQLGTTYPRVKVLIN